jgi:hypothetical protein
MKQLNDNKVIHNNIKYQFIENGFCDLCDLHNLSTSCNKIQCWSGSNDGRKDGKKGHYKQINKFIFQRQMFAEYPLYFFLEIHY